MEKEKGLHNGHRLRMKERFRNSSIDNFADHEIIELLLYFGIPFANTNEIAHSLLNKFGSISDIFDADYNELIKVKGISEHSATLITLIPALSRKYSEDKSRDKKIYPDAQSCGELVLTHFIGSVNEHVEVFLFDHAGHLTDHTTLSDSALSEGSIDPERLGEILFTGRASAFLLAHNHPSGILKPSDEDLSVTRELYMTFRTLNKYMTGHLLVCDNRYIDILDEALEMYD